MSHTLSGSLEYGEVLRRVADMIVPWLADYCIVDLVTECGEVRREILLHRDPERQALLDRLRHFPPARNAGALGVSYVLRTGEPALVPEVTEIWLRALGSEEEELAILRALASRSDLIVPLRARERVIGAISLSYNTSGRCYSRDELQLAEALAARVALAIDTARLFHQAEESRGEAERRARQEAAIREAAGAVNAAYTTEDVIRNIANSAVTATNADGAYVERIDMARGEVEIVAVAGSRTPLLGGRIPYRGSFTERVVESGAPDIVPRISGAQQHLPGDLVRSCPDCSVAVVPLIGAGEPFGALILVRTPEKWIFRPDETARALTFGDLATLVFRRVHMMEEAERGRMDLERVTESRARLMRGFSHDVKNPLGAADGFLQLLEEGLADALTQKQRESVGRARRSIGNALRLIEDLLTLARPEAGRLEIQNVPTDVRDAARETAGEYRADAEGKGLTLVLDLPDRFPVLRSDSVRVRQILSNLLSNAIKYTAQGGVIVSVGEREGGAAPGPGRWAAVDINDTGLGIPEQKRELLFQEFRRLEGELETTGAGIGLAISTRLAHALGGAITVESEVGVGSTFTLWLPMTREVQ